jgi:hypothetical protein
MVRICTLATHALYTSYSKLQDQDLALAKLLQEQERAFLSIAGIQGYVIDFSFLFFSNQPISKFFILINISADRLKTSLQLPTTRRAQSAAPPLEKAQKAALLPMKSSLGSSCKKKKQNFNAV